MEERRIAELLEPFLRGTSLTGAVLHQLAQYLELLERWNARMNLSAVRDPESIVSRHYGESLFLATRLFPVAPDRKILALRALDFGSGAGFPGLPLKIFAPELRLTLVEANQKKAFFLREVIRWLRLADADVYAGRAEQLASAAGATPDLAGLPPDLVTMRAVERFENAVQLAARLVAPGGRLALLIGEHQARAVPENMPAFTWSEPERIPHSRERVIMIGKNRGREESD
jgi:16S rRNA (guanine527-N7)-methyltransferase